MLGVQFHDTSYKLHMYCYQGMYNETQSWMTITSCLSEVLHWFTHSGKIHIDEREKIVKEPLFRELEVIKGSLDKLDLPSLIERLETKFVLQERNRKIRENLREKSTTM